MSGRLVSQPHRHTCKPGWTEYVIESGGPLGIPDGTIGLHPPEIGIPAGSIWECDCGRTWVAHYPQYRNCISFVPKFRPEGRIERWRRTRKENP